MIMTHFKAHIVFQHIPEFIKLVNTDKEEKPVGKFYFNIKFSTYSSIIPGLGYYSEQSFESLHSDMKVHFFHIFNTCILIYIVSNQTVAFYCI